MSRTPRPEYPRPQLVRSRWTNLNGPWAFGVDDDDAGLRDTWYAITEADLDRASGPFDQRIIVPFAVQTELSGIADTTRHDVVWYARVVEDVRDSPDERLLVHFGAVDYRATVWIDGHRVADHEGGHTPFSADITDVVRPRSVIVVRAEDPLDDLEIPRGKQFWGERPEGIFYTPTTGIWQTVWLEPVAARRIAAVSFLPDVDRGTVSLRIDTIGATPGDVVSIAITSAGEHLVDEQVTVTGRVIERTVSVVPGARAKGGRAADSQGVRLWSPEEPNLHDVQLSLSGSDGAVHDVVGSYFGMRSVGVRGDRVLLNGRPYTQRLVLDQGYFPGGNLTAATDEDLRRDIELAKELGFNGARKHQKVEDPRWLHWADRLGFLVWDEMPSAYEFSDTSVRRLISEWTAVIDRDRNHPCVIAWVPLNESWGVPNLTSDASQRALLRTLYHLTKSLDPSRLVVSNDGWEHATSDLCTIHDYGTAEQVAPRYAALDERLRIAPAGRALHVAGHHYDGEPILVTEFGGIALDDSADSWGYHEVADGTALAERYRELVHALVSSPHLHGFCYTQLTDVEQEANGLLTTDRKPKADPDELARATTLRGGAQQTNT